MLLSTLRQNRGECIHVATLTHCVGAQQVDNAIYSVHEERFLFLLQKKENERSLAFMRYLKLWVGLTLVMVASFVVLGYFGREIYRQAPPIPERVVTPDGAVLFT